jgi:hypothetical protein
MGFAPFWNVWLVELIPHTIFLRTHDNCAIRRSSKCPTGYSPACVGPVSHDSRLTIRLPCSASSAMCHPCYCTPMALILLALRPP